MNSNRGVAVVTGASSGIGRETAIQLAGKGFKVIAAARREDRLKALAAESEQIVPYSVDLTAEGPREDFCRLLQNYPGPVSVLINNAGFSLRGGLEDLSLDQVRGLFELNVFALIRVTQACLPGMRRLRAGTIVNLSSIVGKFAFPFSGVYAATKHAVEAISDALRLEVRPFGIRVITVRPGPIASEFNEVANRLTGDLLARTDPDYLPVYQAYGAGMGQLFFRISIPGAALIAQLISEAGLSEHPKPVYAAGPLVEEILDHRTRLDDEAFDQLMAEKTGLQGLRVG
jgi:short-subunit dehydrogenase